MKNNNNRDFKKVLESLDANEIATNGKLLNLIDNCITPLALGSKQTAEGLIELTKDIDQTNQGVFQLLKDMATMIETLQKRVDELEK